MKSRYQQPVEELAPDLEWMLSSHQVSSSLLLETLLREYYTPVYWLAFSVLDDPRAARQTTIDTFRFVLRDVHRYRSVDGVENWLAKIAWKTCRRTYRREKLWSWIEKRLSLHGQLTDANSAVPTDATEALLWQAVDELGEQSRLVCILSALHGWSIDKISLVTGAPVRSVEARLESAVQQISASLEGKGLSTDEIGPQVTAALQHRWTVPEIEADELEQLGAVIEKQTHRWKMFQGTGTTPREMAVLVVIAIAVLGLAWGGNQLLFGRSLPKKALPVAAATLVAQSPDHTSEVITLMPRFDTPFGSLQTASTTTETPLGIFYIGPSGNALAIVAARLGVTVEQLKSLNRIPDEVQRYEGQWLWVPSLPGSSGSGLSAPSPQAANYPPPEVPKIAEDLNKLLYPSQPIYHSVWVDALLSFGENVLPAATPHQMRIQLWLAGGQGLLMGGPADQVPEEVLLWNGDVEYVAKPGLSKPAFESASEGFGSAPVSLPLMYGMLMMLKSTDIWDSPNLIYIEPGHFAGRETWVVEVADSKNDPVSLVHLDKKTGFVLHEQRLKHAPAPSNPELSLPEEVTVRKIVFDASFPQELFDPSLPPKGGYAADYTGHPAADTPSP